MSSEHRDSFEIMQQRYADGLQIMLLEIENIPEFKHSHDVAVIATIQSALAALLQASLTISNDLTEPSRINPLAIIAGLSELLNWIQDNNPWQLELEQKNNG